MAITKIIKDLLASDSGWSTSSENGLRMPTGGAFSGTPLQGMIRNEVGQVSEGSASTMQHYNGIEWKNFVNFKDAPINALENFNTVLYPGNGSTKSISTVGFKPDLVWVKRTTAPEDNVWFDSVRGVQNQLVSNKTNGESTKTNALSSFDTNGFTTGANNALNTINQTYVAWCWKAAGAANTFNVLEGGTVTSDSTASGAGITAGSITTGWGVSANRDAGFSIVKYTGNGANGATLGHGLSQAPELIITKGLSTAYNWSVVTSLLQNGYLELNTTSGFNSNSSRYITAGTTTNSLTNYVQFNQNNINHTSYCFHSVAGYQKVDSYTGTGNTKTISTEVTSGDGGFEPRWILIKNTTPGTSGSWWMYDAVRNPSNPRNTRLVADQNFSEATNTSGNVNFNSNSFDLLGSYHGTNANNNTYIYLVIA